MTVITASEARTLAENRNKATANPNNAIHNMFMKMVQEAAECGKTKLAYNFKMDTVALMGASFLEGLGYSCHIIWYENVLYISW